MSSKNDVGTTFHDLVKRAMSSDHLEHGKKQAGNYLSGSMGTGDTIAGDAAVDPVKGQVDLVAFTWGHVKTIDVETMQAALPQQVGVVLGIPMYNGSVPIFQQALYAGTPAKQLIITLTRFTSKGAKIEKYGTITFNNARVASVVYDGHSTSGPVVFVGLMPEDFEVTIDKKSFKYNVVTMSES